MEKTQLYVLIAVFLFLTVALVWTGAKSWLDMRRRRQNRNGQRRKTF